MNRILFLGLLTLIACGKNREPELQMIVHNAFIWDGEEIRKDATAFSIVDGKFLDFGDEEWATNNMYNAAQIIDAQGLFVMPGFIEGHGHFTGYAKGLQNINLLHIKDWSEAVAKVEKKVQSVSSGEWIIGRGWHQEKLTDGGPRVQGYPTNEEISRVSPDHPVLLSHASGHAVMANKKAMELAGITKDSPDPEGGRIVRDEEGNPIGVFEENAEELLWSVYESDQNKLSEEERFNKWSLAMIQAQDSCFKNGITSFQDAGSRKSEIDGFKKLVDEDELRLRLWVMLRHKYPEIKDQMEGLPLINYGEKDVLTVNAIKSEIDGALGSYGAWLLEPYTDRPDLSGEEVTPVADIDKLASIAKENGMQLCVHAIGDKGNRKVLDVMAKHISKSEDHRWRIEHAQHLNEADISRFAELGVIPSMQGIHCTSDAPYVVKRLGMDRAREGAYVWRKLLDEGNIIANGTDVPVEEISPFHNLYASITRNPFGTDVIFFPQQVMNKSEALKSYTLWNAYSSFQEDKLGKIETGKLADFIVLDHNLLLDNPLNLHETKVLKTVVGGNVVYSDKVRDL